MVGRCHAGSAGRGIAYNRTITYVDFATAVQDATGVETRSLLQNWIGEVLGAVARAQPPDEPMLTALVIRADGTIGPGYADPIADRSAQDCARGHEILEGWTPAIPTPRP